MAQGFTYVELNGELKARIDSCSNRMELSDYSVSNIFQPISYEWYGDWEGRTLLAMQCLFDFTGNQGKNFKEIKEEISNHINNKGFFGPEINSTNINEQQFAGNSWYLRYLCNSYESNKSKKRYDEICNLTNNLYLNHFKEISGYYYNPKLFENENYAAGCLVEKNGEWNLSSDSGCLFIALDGLSHSHKITKDKKTEELIDVLVDRFSLVGTDRNHMQSHAFLTGIRGLIRYFNTTGKEKVFNLAKKYFDYYLHSSINYTYENFGIINKFCGSEGCAVIDSGMLCIQFYEITKDPTYLSYYRKIYENAIKVTQRENGGFGCNIGVWKENDYLESVREFAEAFWCCTMRGCEGITYFINNTFLVDGDKITVILPNDCTASFFDGKVVMKVKTDYPYNGKTTFEIIKCDIPFTLNFDLLDSYQVDTKEKKFRIEKCGQLSINHTGKILKRPLFEKMGYEWGDLVLAEAIDNNRIINIDNRKLQPLISFSDIKMEDTLKVKQRVLF